MFEVGNTIFYVEFGKHDDLDWDNPVEVNGQKAIPAQEIFHAEILEYKIVGRVTTLIEGDAPHYVNAGSVAYANITAQHLDIDKNQVLEFVDRWWDVEELMTLDETDDRFFRTLEEAYDFLEKETNGKFQRPNTFKE